MDHYQSRRGESSVTVGARAVKSHASRNGLQETGERREPVGIPCDITERGSYHYGGGDREDDRAYAKFVNIADPLTSNAGPGRVSVHCYPWCKRRDRSAYDHGTAYLYLCGAICA